MAKQVYLCNLTKQQFKQHKELWPHGKYEGKVIGLSDHQAKLYSSWLDKIEQYELFFGEQYA